MKFIIPDPKTMRVSECGRYLLVKREISVKEGAPAQNPVYEVWKYSFMAAGFNSAAEAMKEIERTESEADAINASLTQASAKL